MIHKKNTNKTPILKYIRVAEGQWNVIRKDPGETEFRFVKPSCRTEKEVKELLWKARERLK
jgi:hypothetical protein